MVQKSRKVNFINFILIVIFLIGMGILLYPNISDYFNRKNSSKAIATYDEELNEVNEKEREAIYQSAEEYNEGLRSDAGRFSVSEERHEQYMKELNIDGKGMMGVLEVGKLDLKVPIYHTTDESVLQNAVGHVEGTSLPVGGLGTHAALSAHTGLPSAVLFSNLEKLEEGDVFTVHILGKELHYVIDQIAVVLPGDTSELAIDPNEDYVTLITCTPYGVNSHRLLVRGKRVLDPKDPAIENAENAKLGWTRENIVSAIAAAFGVVFCGLLLFLIPAQIVRKGIRPWDEGFLDVINGAILIADNATRENWEVHYVAEEADWLANLRRWDEKILTGSTLTDKEFENTDLTKKNPFDHRMNPESTVSDSEAQIFESMSPELDITEERYNRTYSFFDKFEGAREYDEYWYEDKHVKNTEQAKTAYKSANGKREEQRKEKVWDKNILEKVTQNWGQISVPTYRDAVNYIDFDKPGPKPSLEKDPYEQAVENEKKENARKHKKVKSC